MLSHPDLYFRYLPHDIIRYYLTPMIHDLRGCRMPGLGLETDSQHGGGGSL